MRPAFIVTLLLLLPIVQGLSPSLEPEKAIGGEHGLVLEEGFWTQEQWGALESFGYTPLRMLSSAEVLTWKSSDAVKLEDVSQRAPPLTQYKGDLVQFEEHQLHRFVFEPRLPPEAVRDIVSAFAYYGADIETDVESYASVLPVSYTHLTLPTKRIV